MSAGDNAVYVTARAKDGIPYYPGKFIINREQAIAKYGICEINKCGLKGVMIPTDDLEQYKAEACYAAA